MIRKHLVIAVLATFCLTSTLFMTIPTSGSPGAGDYDPWLDGNDDGKIDMRDIGAVARAFGAKGTPINKTALLYNVNDTFTELLSRIDSLNSSLLGLLDTVDNLNASVQQCSGQIIKFHHPNEEVIPYYGTWTVATFTWTPKNSSNNVILSANGWAEFKCPNQTTGILVHLSINGAIGHYVQNMLKSGQPYQLSYLNYWSVRDAVALPPSPSYTIEYQVIGGLEDFPIFVKNINVILHIADGVPTSNP